MKIKKISLFFLWFVLEVSFCFAQPKYTFSSSSQVYKNLENAIVLNDSNFPDYYDELMVSVDFPIFYFGKRLYSVLVKNNGEITFSTPEERIELFPVQLKLKPNSKISYIIKGKPNCGNRILKIEYQNMGFRCDTSNTYFANAQLWIYENTGLIEIHFGASFDNPAIYSDTENNCSGIFPYGSRLRFDQNLSALPYNDPDQPAFFEGDLSNHSTYGIENIPSSGILFRFDPELFTYNHFKISPNPARYFVNISRPLNCGEFQIRLFNSKVQLLFQKEFTSPSQFIDTSNLIPGIYFIQVWNKHNDVFFVEKLLIL